MLLYSVIYLQILVNVVQAISDTVIIKMPSFVQEGGETRLSCYFDHVLDGKPLYQLQWQFNGREFYRFNGKYVPKLQYFAIPGFDVDLDNSSEGSVSLKNMTSKATGRYSCEISADGNFHTFRADQTLQVGSRNHGGFSKGGWSGCVYWMFIERMFLISLLMIFNSWISRTSQNTVY